MDDKRLRWFEVALVLLVAFGSPMLSSLSLLNFELKQDVQMSVVRTLATILHELSSLLLLGYVLTRRGRNLRELGLQWRTKDLGIGVIVAFVAMIAYRYGAWLLQLLYYESRGEFASSRSNYNFYANPTIFTALPIILLNPFFEELLVRAYLMTEITNLTGSVSLAVVVSVAVQAAYHLYYGWFGALSLGFLFLVFALYYAHSRRAVPLIVAHGLFDLFGFAHLFLRTIRTH